MEISSDIIGRYIIVLNFFEGAYITSAQIIGADERHMIYYQAKIVSFTLKISTKSVIWLDQDC